MRSVQKVSSHVIWKRHLLKKVQETLCIGQWHLSPLQSRHLGTSHGSPSNSSAVQNILQNPLLGLLSAVPLHYLESHQWSEIPSLSKVILVLGKARSRRAPNLGWRGAESLGWFGVLPKHSAWHMMHEQTPCQWRSYQSPVAHCCGCFHHMASSQLMKNIKEYSLLIVWPGGVYLWWTTPS